MKSVRIFSQMLLVAIGVLAQSEPDLQASVEFSLDAVGMTLPASEGSLFTSVTGQWTAPNEIFSSLDGESLEWYSQFVAVDLLPVPFTLFNDDPPPPIPASAQCANFLQVGTNITSTFSGDNPQLFWAFYVWNNVTTNLTDTSGDLVLLNPGETVTVTINISEDGASFVYDSTEHSVVEVELEGELCKEFVGWAIGSPSAPGDLAPSTDNGDWFFSGSFATEVDTTSGVVSTVGPDAPGGLHTLLVVADDPNGGYNGKSLVADVALDTLSNEGFTMLFEPDCADYKKR